MPMCQRLLVCACAGIAAFTAVGVVAHETEDSHPVGLATAIVQAQRNIDERVLRIRDDIYLFAGAESNSVIQIGEDGVLVVDTLRAAEADALLRAIRQLSPRPIRYVVNTDGHGNHAGGNAVIAAAGETVTGGNVVTNLGASASAGAAVIAHESVLARLTAGAFPSVAWPTETFTHVGRDLFFNGEGIRIGFEPQALTGGNSIVYFRRSDVVVAGDVFTMTGYPEIDVRDGGSFMSTLAAINAMIDVAIPRLNQEGGTIIVPGRGRLTDEADLVEYRDMLTIIRDRIQRSVSRGKTLDQVLAERPTLDYDARWGVERQTWTTKMFIETVYRELVKLRPSQPNPKVKGNQ